MDLIPLLKGGKSQPVVHTIGELHSKNMLYFPAYLTTLGEVELVNLGELLMEYAKDAEKMKLVVTLLSITINAETLNSPGSHRLLEAIIQIITDKALLEGGYCWLIESLIVERGVLPSGLKSFFLYTLNMVLCSCNDTCDNSDVSHLSNALSTQVRFWNYDSSTFLGCRLIQQLTAKLSAEEVWNEVWPVTTEKNVSWNSLFQVLSVIIHQPLLPRFKKCLESRLKQSVDEKSQMNSVLTLILMRGVCSGPSEYATWHASLHSLLPSHSNFIFWIDCLSQIVPLEPAICLKIHVNKVPSAPQGAHSALADYIALVRARLSELNETTDWGGLFGGDDDGQGDIKRVLTHFENTEGQVMCAVLEAAVFRKDYYERVFLRRLVSTALEGNKSAGQLLEKLHVTGKCPGSIYIDWKSRASRL